MKLRNTQISIPAQRVWLDGLLSHAPDVRGLVMVLHSDAHHGLSLAANPLETTLHEAGFATIRLNLLTHQETLRDPDASFNVPRHTERILAAVEWVGHQPPLAELQLAIAARDTGCAAAIRAAVRAPDCFAALACMDGRPDLAGAEPLRMLHAPVRFIVDPGSANGLMLERAFALLKGPRNWLALPETIDQNQHDTLQARAVTSWFETHTLPPEDTEAPATLSAGLE